MKKRSYIGMGVFLLDVDIFWKLGDKLKKLDDKQSKVLDKSQNCFDKPLIPEKKATLT